MSDFKEMKIETRNGELGFVTRFQTTLTREQIRRLRRSKNISIRVVKEKL